MHADESPDPFRAVCRLSGDLDEGCSTHLRATMAASAAFEELYIDLSEVRFLDSAALGALVGGIRRIHSAGGIVTVCGIRRTIRRVLEIAGFDRVVPIGDRSAAPSLFRPAIAVGT